MAQLYAQNFTASDGTTVASLTPQVGSGALTRNTDFTSDSIIYSNKARVNAAGAAAVHIWTGGSSYQTADHSVSADLTPKAGNPDYTGVVLRQRGTGSNYGAWWLLNPNTLGWQIFLWTSVGARFVGSAWTDSTLAVDGSVTRTAKFEITGNTLKGYVDGVLRQTETLTGTDLSDLPAASGYAGIYISCDATVGDATGVHLDNLSIDSVGGGGGPTANPHYYHNLIRA